MSNHFTDPTPAGAADKERLAARDIFEASDLPLKEPNAASPRQRTSLKQRVFAHSRNVSRATLRADISVEEDSKLAEHADFPNERLDLEISDLPPTQASHAFLLKLAQVRKLLENVHWGHARKSARLSPALRRQRVRNTFTLIGICAALLVLLIGNLPGLRSQIINLVERSPTPVPTPGVRFTSGPMPIIVNHFGTAEPSSLHDSPGQLPATCPQISTLQYFTTPLDPPGLGASPLWLSGFTGPSAALDRLMPIDAQVAHAPWPGGWYETVAVFIQKGYTGDIILRGGSQENGAPVWLSKDSPQILSTKLVLNLNDGSHFMSNGQWEMTSITIAVPQAGCYALQASWSDSLWTRFFAAGR